MSVLENDFDGIVYFFLPPRGFCEVINYHQGRIKGGGDIVLVAPLGTLGVWRDKIYGDKYWEKSDIWQSVASLFF